MKAKAQMEKWLILRQKGAVRFFLLFTADVMFKTGGILFLLLVVGDFLLDYKRMKAIGIWSSISETAAMCLIYGFIAAVILGICIETLYRRKK